MVKLNPEVHRHETPVADDDQAAPAPRGDRPGRPAPEQGPGGEAWSRRASPSSRSPMALVENRRTGGRVVDSEDGRGAARGEPAADLERAREDRRAAGWRPSRCVFEDPDKNDALGARDAGSRTTSRTPTRRWWRSTGGCGRAIRRPWSRRAPCSAACSWTPRRYDLAAGRALHDQQEARRSAPPLNSRRSAARTSSRSSGTC